jgi:hypothetical protein
MEAGRRLPTHSAYSVSVHVAVWKMVVQRGRRGALCGPSLMPRGQSQLLHTLDSQQRGNTLMVQGHPRSHTAACSYLPSRTEAHTVAAARGGGGGVWHTCTAAAGTATSRSAAPGKYSQLRSIAGHSTQPRQPSNQLNTTCVHDHLQWLTPTVQVCATPAGAWTWHARLASNAPHPGSAWIDEHTP